MEHALNLDPTASDVNSPNLPQSQMAIRSYNAGSYLSIRFTRVPLATDITYIVESSADLLTWTGVAKTTKGAAFTGSAAVSDDAANQSPHTVEIRDTVTVGARRRFLRLRVTLP